MTTYEIRVKGGKVIYHKENMDEVLSTLNRNSLIRDYEVVEVKTKPITDTVKRLLMSGDEMKEIREKNRGKQFDSYRLKGDYALPYVFDLNYDIKSEGELAFELEDGFSDDLAELALAYGYTEEYLKSLPIKK